MDSSTVQNQDMAAFIWPKPSITKLSHDNDVANKAVKKVRTVKNTAPLDFRPASKTKSKVRAPKVTIHRSYGA